VVSDLRSRGVSGRFREDAAAVGRRGAGPVSEVSFSSAVFPSPRTATCDPEHACLEGHHEASSQHVGRVRRTTERWRSAPAIDTGSGPRGPSGTLRSGREAGSLSVSDAVAAPPPRPVEFGDPREPWLNLIADLIVDDLQRERPP
jgi:hypothetical protein